MTASAATTIHLNAAEGKAYGPCAAALLGHIRFWVNENEKHGRNLRDGCAWTYDSFEALAERLVMFTAHQVRRGIEKLIRLGVIVRGYYGAHKWDRTSWYTLADASSTAIDDAGTVEDEATAQEAPKQAKPENPVMDYVREHGLDGSFHYDPNEVDLQSVDFLRAKGVDHQIALDWMVTRNNKAVTPRLWAWVKNEAKIAGITPQAAVKWACQRSYEIFKAGWYLRQNPKSPANWSAESPEQLPFFDDGDYSNTVTPI